MSHVPATLSAASNDRAITRPGAAGPLATAWAWLLHRVGACAWGPSNTQPSRPEGVVRLARHGWRSIARPVGLSVRCLTGIVVLTQEGDARDHLLAAGQVMHVQGDGHLYVQAAQEAEVSFSAALIESKFM